MSLELAAMRWFRWERRFPILLRERTPRYGHGQPDVLAVSAARYMYEVEIKRSRSDFRADFDKPSRRIRDLRPWMYPKEFYYMMPPDLAEKCRDEIPEWAGLATLSRYSEFEILKPAPVNRESKRLSLKECVKLAHLMANHIISADTQLNCYQGRFTYGDEVILNPPEYQI